ncbi:MAG TPA: FtsX-like permease family protein [Chryseosolibacter sp.]|nr:FtsX-like permease family protein [Chryseosolibacter sp.]
MLRNYFLTTIRQLWKNKFYFFINVFGLASSTAVAVMILIYVFNVLTYDTFHSNIDNIYFLYRDRPSTEGPLSIYDTWYPLLDETRNAFPEVTGGTRIIAGSNTWMEHEGKLWDEEFMWADSGFFHVFDFPIIAGNKESALLTRNSLVVSEALAKRMFGNEDPIGKTVRLFFNTDYVVTAVVGELPSNSSIQFNAIVPMHPGIQFIGEAGWGSSFIYTFIVTRPGTDIEALRTKSTELLRKFVPTAERGNARILPMKQYNDEFSDQRKYAMMLSGIAVGILLLAAINFTNLASSQSFSRMKEVGMRKALGATRSKVTFQFLSESMLLSFLSLLIGLGLAQLLLPIFSDLVRMPLTLAALIQPIPLAALLLLGLLVGLASGFYPAFFASGFQPVKVLKGLGTGHNKGTVLRSSLLAFQFGIAIFLISGVAIVLQQVNHMKSKDLNFEKDNVMVMRASPRDFADVEAAERMIGSFRDQVQELASVVAVSRSSGVPGNYSGSFSLFVAEGNETADPFDWRVARVDAQFFDVYKIPFVEGRNFVKGSETDRLTGAIINEATMRAIGWKSAVGKKLKFPGDDGYLEIVGVTQDFNYGSVAEAVQPVVHVYRGEQYLNYPYVSIQLQPGVPQKNTIAQVGALWQKLNPDRSFEYFFPSDTFNDLYNTEENIASIITFASVLAVVIACLGLFALASFNMAQRQKEVAVRKVMGASVSGLAVLFIRKYLLLVVIAAVISIPVTWYFAEDWLSDFAYRITINPLVMLGAGLMCAFIAVATIAIKSIRTASSNPVNSLKYE